MEPDPEPEQMLKTLFVPEPMHKMESDQVLELATLSILVDVLVKYEGMDWCPAHTPATEDELCLASVQFYEEVEGVIPQSLLHPRWSHLVPSLLHL